LSGGEGRVVQKVLSKPSADSFAVGRRQKERGKKERGKIEISRKRFFSLDHDTV
jgi:hypothetical protein